MPAVQAGPGATLPSPACPVCREPILADAAFCMSCGTPLGPDQPGPIPAGPQPSRTSGLSGKNPVGIVVIGVIVVAVVVLAFIAFSRGHRTTTVSPPVSTPSPAQLPSTGREVGATPTSSGSAVSAQNEIQTLLSRWAETFRQQNMDGQAECYAPVVESYFRKRSLDRTQIKMEREKLFEDYGPMRDFTISNIEFVSVSSEQATVRFRTRWELSGRGYFAGEDIEELMLKRIEGDWKIIGEEEPTVFWVKKRKAKP